MPGVKQASKRKRMTKAVPALGAVGLTFSLVGERIGIGRADSGHSADTEHGTGSRNHPRRRGNLRR